MIRRAIDVRRSKDRFHTEIPWLDSRHSFVPKGAGILEGTGRLEQGDAARLTAAGTPTFTADPTTGAELLIWEMNPNARRNPSPSEGF